VTGFTLPYPTYIKSYRLTLTVSGCNRIFEILLENSRTHLEFNKKFWEELIAYFF
jgi:hypothetical protein